MPCCNSFFSGWTGLAQAGLLTHLYLRGLSNRGLLAIFPNTTLRNLFLALTVVMNAAFFLWVGAGAVAGPRCCGCYHLMPWRLAYAGYLWGGRTSAASGRHLDLHTCALHSM